MSETSGNLSPKTLPAWLQPVKLEEWPTYSFESSDLHLRIEVPEDWAVKTTTGLSPDEKEVILRGRDISETLSINFLAAADPSAPLKNWVELILGLTGFPLPGLVVADKPQPGLLDWEEVEPTPEILQQLKVDELLLYKGLAVFREPYTTLVRLYLLVARRETTAWKIGLSFMSALPPGLPEPLITANDHVRAGAVLGYLELL